MYSKFIDLFGDRYLMEVTSLNFIVSILHLSRYALALRSGLPRSHSAPVALHFVVSSSSPVCLLYRRSFFISIWRFSRVSVVMLISYAYPWASYDMQVLAISSDYSGGL